MSKRNLADTERVTGHVDSQRTGIDERDIAAARKRIAFIASQLDADDLIEFERGGLVALSATRRDVHDDLEQLDREMRSPRHVAFNVAPCEHTAVCTQCAFRRRKHANTCEPCKRGSEHALLHHLGLCECEEPREACSELVRELTGPCPHANECTEECLRAQLDAAARYAREGILLGDAEKIDRQRRRRDAAAKYQAATKECHEVGECSDAEMLRVNDELRAAQASLLAAHPCPPNVGTRGQHQAPDHAYLPFVVKAWQRLWKALRSSSLDGAEVNAPTDPELADLVYGDRTLAKRITDLRFRNKQSATLSPRRETRRK